MEQLRNLSTGLPSLCEGDCAGRCVPVGAQTGENARHPRKGTGGGTSRYSAMQRPLDMEAIFPIKDAASAALMAIKADCLRKAGVISDQEKQWVDSRVRTLLHDAGLKEAA
jgi:hypothetical protein